MASILMHLYVGRYFADKFGKLADLPLFYLGCILPDSVNIDGFASKDVRWAAHLRARDSKNWYKNNIEFYRGNTGSVDESLLLGYVVHNITDAAWDENFHDRVWAEMEKLKRPCVMGDSCGWDECYRFDRDQSREDWWTREVLPALRRAVPVGINGISAETVGRYLKEITGEYVGTIPEGGAVMIDVKMMDTLAELVCGVAEKAGIRFEMRPVQ